MTHKETLFQMDIPSGEICFQQGLQFRKAIVLLLESFKLIIQGDKNLPS